MNAKTRIPALPSRHRATETLRSTDIGIYRDPAPALAPGLDGNGSRWHAFDEPREAKGKRRGRQPTASPLGSSEVLIDSTQQTRAPYRHGTHPDPRGKRSDMRDI